jgi:CheY-like chemotaxis protein
MSSEYGPRRSADQHRAERRVLIVDDDAGMRTSLTRLVRSWGHEIAVAATAEEALSLAETFRPEFAIIDVSLRGMTGVELARSLRQTYPPHRLHLIALTAYQEEGVRDECIAAGFDTFLVKPEGIAEMQGVLGRV